MLWISLAALGLFCLAMEVLGDLGRDNELARNRLAKEKEAKAHKAWLETLTLEQHREKLASAEKNFARLIQDWGLESGTIPRDAHFRWEDFCGLLEHQAHIVRLEQGCSFDDAWKVASKLYAKKRDALIAEQNLRIKAAGEARVQAYYAKEQQIAALANKYLDN